VTDDDGDVAFVRGPIARAALAGSLLLIEGRAAKKRVELLV
jgi:hypothetical protein